MKKYSTPKRLWMILMVLVITTIFANIYLVHYLTPLIEVTPQHITVLVIVQILLGVIGFLGAMLYSKKKAR